MLRCQKDLFRIPSEVSYLNTAYMSPLLRQVEAIGQEAVSRKALPYEISSTDFFTPVSRLKQSFAQLIQTSDWERIAVIPSASYGMANVANNVPCRAGQEILVVEDQFPSNIYAWKRKAQTEGLTIRSIASPPPSPTKSQQWNDAILAAISSKTAVVALPHVHWSEGIIFDLKAIRQKTREVGAFLVIDGTQSIGAFPFSVDELEVDALVCGGYKWLLGPYSLGLAYYGEAFDKGIPIEDNWINRKDSEDFSSLVNYQDSYKPKAYRYSMGEGSNFILVPMLTAAIEQLNQWGVEQIQTYCEQVTAAPIESLQAKGFGVLDAEERAAHLFGIELPNGMDTKALQARLAAQQIYVSIRGKYVRVAPHVFNTEEDLERMVKAIVHSP